MVEHGGLTSVNQFNRTLAIRWICFPHLYVSYFKLGHEIRHSSTINLFSCNFIFIWQGLHLGTVRVMFLQNFRQVLLKTSKPDETNMNHYPKIIYIIIKHNQQPTKNIISSIRNQTPPAVTHFFQLQTQQGLHLYRYDIRSFMAEHIFRIMTLRDRGVAQDENTTRCVEQTTQCVRLSQWTAIRTKERRWTGYGGSQHRTNEGTTLEDVVAKCQFPQNALRPH